MSCPGGLMFGTLFGMRFAEGACSVMGCQEEGNGCNFHLDCCDKLYCSSGLLGALLSAVVGSSSGTCKVPATRRDSLANLPSSAAGILAQGSCQSEADRGALNAKEMSCDSSAEGELGAICVLSLEFCVFGLVDGNLLTVTLVLKHEFGYESDGQRLRYRLSGGFKASEVKFQCDGFIAKWFSACGVLGSAQRVLDSLGLDLGGMLSPDLSGSVMLWPPRVALPSSLATSQEELVVIMDVGLGSICSVVAKPGTSTCFPDLLAKIKAGELGEENQFSDNMLRTLKLVSEDMLGCTLCIDICRQAEDLVAVEQGADFTFDPKLELVFFDPTQVNIVNGVFSILAEGGGQFMKVMGQVGNLFAKTAVGDVIFNNLDHGFASYLPSPRLVLSASLSEFKVVGGEGGRRLTASGLNLGVLVDPSKKVLSAGTFSPVALQAGLIDKLPGSVCAATSGINSTVALRCTFRFNLQVIAIDVALELQVGRSFDGEGLEVSIRFGFGSLGQLPATPDPALKSFIDAMEAALGCPLLALVHPVLGDILQIYPLKLAFPRDFQAGGRTVVATFDQPTTLVTSSSKFCFSTLKELANNPSKLSKRSGSRGKKFIEVLGAVYSVLELTGSDFCLSYKVEAVGGSISISDPYLVASMLDKTKMNVMSILGWPIWGPYTWLVNLVRSVLERRRLTRNESPCRRLFKETGSNLESNSSLSLSCLEDIPGLAMGIEDHIAKHKTGFEVVAGSYLGATSSVSERHRRLASDREQEERRRVTAISRGLSVLSDINMAITDLLPISTFSVSFGLTDSSVQLGSIAPSLKASAPTPSVLPTPSMTPPPYAAPLPTASSLPPAQTNYSLPTPSVSPPPYAVPLPTASSLPPAQTNYSLPAPSVSPPPYAVPLPTASSLPPAQTNYSLPAPSVTPPPYAAPFPTASSLPPAQTNYSCAGADPGCCYYQHWRFVTIKVRSGLSSSGISIAELNLYGPGGSVPMDLQLVSTDGSELPGSEPVRAFDGNAASSWKNDRLVPLQFSFASPVGATSWTYTTASGSSLRDPVLWRLEASGDGTAWVLAHEQNLEDLSASEGRSVKSEFFPLSCQTSLKVTVASPAAPRSFWWGLGLLISGVVALN
ncbi:unnamed protein product [Polarella glacialis]|uniref:Uncharacterized protein n=1 Tax=Polarella glacialis TaxID=89957 RepID=A0A813K5R2_POLGL|nr:unnamed protein product [Polarella glacialis]